MKERTLHLINEKMKTKGIYKIVKDKKFMEAGKVKYYPYNENEANKIIEDLESSGDYRNSQFYEPEGGEEMKIIESSLLEKIAEEKELDFFNNYLSRTQLRKIK